MSRLEVVTLLVLSLCMCALPKSHARHVPAFAPGPAPGPDQFDDCANLYGPMEHALACMQSFPFNLTVAKATIDTLLKLIPQYVFEDLARDSPEPLLPSKVLLKEGLESILASAVAGQYATEYAFETEVTALFHRLNDAHTTYQPSCFSVWSYTHGFLLTSVVKDGKQQIIMAPAEYQEFLMMNFPDYLKYAGWQVLEIDGIPAVDYITDFAESRVGWFKDLNARFNAALFNLHVNTSGSVGVSSGTFASQTIPPAKGTVTFLFSDGAHKKELTATYFATYSGAPFSSQEEYFLANCAPLPTDNEAGGANVRRALAEAPDTDLDVDIQEVVSTFNLVKEMVGVITIPSVGGDGNLVDYARFEVSFVLGIEELKAAGVTRLIIDLTENGGGSVDLAYWLTNSLFPKEAENLPTRLRASPLAVLAVETAERNNISESLYHWSNWAKAGKSVKKFTSADDGFFFPLVNFTYGGIEDSWSQLFRDKRTSDTSGKFPRMLVKPFKKAPFAAQDILVLTNGYCGSSCSIITSSLSQLHGVRTVTIGGIKGHPQQISNFPGGQVLHFPDFFAELETLNLGDHPLAPQPFLRQVDFGFTWRALFGPASSSTPLEFVFEPSTFNLEYSTETISSMPALWAEVAKLF